jgi:hypothetical protein
MPRRLYMRCPDCHHGAPGVRCDACGDVGFIPAGISLDDLEKLRRTSLELRRISESIRRLAAPLQPCLTGRRNEWD